MHTVGNYIHSIVVIIFTVVPSCDLMICIVTNVAVPTQARINNKAQRNLKFHNNEHET